MASVFTKNGILYVSWWDASESKSKNRSLKLKDSVANRKEAKKFAKKLQRTLDNQSESLNQFSLTKSSSIKSAFEHFKRNNATKNKKTIKDYDRFYQLFIKTFDENSRCSVINKITAEEWINSIKELSFSQNTIHGYFKQFNHFLNFLFEYDYIPMFKINRDVKTKPEMKEKIVFSDEDINLIFNNLDEKNSNFKTLMYFLFYTGLRPSDVYGITVENIDIKNGILKYYSQKRKMHREIPFHEDLVDILSERIKEVKDGPLFSYTTYGNLGRAVTRYFQNIGLTAKSCSAKTFRKTFITLARSRYKIDATIVRELVGHSHNTTADKYYNKVDVDVMKEELKKFKMPVVDEKETDD